MYVCMYFWWKLRILIFVVIKWLFFPLVVMTSFGNFTVSKHSKLLTYVEVHAISSLWMLNRDSTCCIVAVYRHTVTSCQLNSWALSQSSVLSEKFGGEWSPPTTIRSDCCFSVNFRRKKDSRMKTTLWTGADNDLPTESGAAFPRCPAEQCSETLMFAMMHLSL